MVRAARIVTLCLFVSACANQQRAEREAVLSAQSQALLKKYRQFMTQRQLDEFLAWPDDAAREQYVQGMRVEERLASYPRPIQDAIWAQNVVLGMDKPGVLLSWGAPPSRDFSGEGGNEVETWIYVREQRKYAVVITNGYVTDVIDQGFSR